MPKHCLQYFDTREDITDILEYLGNHSLFIYLMSNTLASGFITLEKLRVEIKEGKVAKIEAHDEKTFNEHLNQRFQQQFETENNDELKLLLQQLSILPSIEIEEKKLHICIKHENLTKNLSKLVKHGWLTKKGSSYKLHQIIRTFLLENAPLEYSYASNIMGSIANYLDPNDSVLIANYELIFIPIIDALLSLYESKQDKYIAGILDSLTLLYYSMGSYQLSLFQQKKSELIRINLFGNASVETARNYNLQGVLFAYMRKNSQALELYEKAFDIREKAFGSNSLEVAQSYHNLASVYTAMKKFPKALQFHKQALAIREKLVGLKHISIAESYNNLACVHEACSPPNYQEALKLFKKALDIKEEVLENKQHPQIALSYNNIGTIYSKTGKYSEALKLYQKSLQIRETVFGFEHPMTADSYFNIAFVSLEIKQCQQALMYIEKALKIVENLDFESSISVKYKKLHSNICNSIKKEKQLQYNKKGRYCTDCLPSS